MSQVYNNQLKFQSIASYNEKQPMYFTELPPTPSSLTLSFRTSEKEDIEQDDALEKLSFRSYSSQYGSIDSSSSSSSSNSSSKSTTHDNDEGLYLYWTNELLKERGYDPSPLKQLIEEEEDDDNESIASSISMHTLYQHKSWLASWFPFC